MPFPSHDQRGWVKSNNSYARLRIDDGVSTYMSVPVVSDGIWHKISHTLTVNASATWIYFQIITLDDNDNTVSITSGDYIEFTGAQLCEGNVVLPYQPRLYENELELCQRYGIALTNDDTTTLYSLIGSGGAVNTTTVQIFCPVPVTLRTISYSLGLISGNWRIHDFVNVFAVNNGNVSILNTERMQNRLTLQIVGFVGLIQYRQYHLTRNNDATAKIFIDAEF